MRSKNDNDPRLDAEFNALTEATKARFRARYSALPAEDRNGRGTIVYLLGRNMKSPGDWEFLRSVVAEPPCRSLADCSAPAGTGGPGDEVTLAYPALVALKRAQKELAAAGAHQDDARRVIAEGRRSPAPAARRLVERPY